MHMTIVVVHSVMWFCFHFSFKEGFLFLCLPIVIDLMSNLTYS